MNTILATEKIIANYDIKYFLYGSPNARLLCDWFQKIDLGLYNILVTDPLDVRNFISTYVIPTEDQVQYNTFDYWLNDITLLFESQKEDCDGLAVLTASILYSLGNPNVRLCAGGRGSISMNHAFCVITDGDDIMNSFLLEATNGNIIESLPRLRDCVEYNILVSASPDRRMWLHGAYADEIAKII